MAPYNESIERFVAKQAQSEGELEVRMLLDQIATMKKEVGTDLLRTFKRYSRIPEIKREKRLEFLRGIFDVDSSLSPVYYEVLGKYGEINDWGSIMLVQLFETDTETLVRKYGIDIGLLVKKGFVEETIGEPAANLHYLLESKQSIHFLTTGKVDEPINPEDLMYFIIRIDGDPYEDGKDRYPAIEALLKVQESQ